MDIVSRLKLFLDHLGIPVTQFADNCGIPRPTLSQLLNGRNKTVRDEIIAKIHEAYPQLSIMWLMFGEGDMVSGEAAPISSAANDGAITNNHENVENSFFTTESSADDENQNLSDFSTGDINSGEMALPLDFMLDSESMHDNGTSSPAELATDTDKRPDLTGPLETPTQHHNSAERIEAKGSDRTITFHQEDMASTPGVAAAQSADKRVVSIIVYYSDNSYQSFIPDPQCRIPMPR